MKTKIILRKLDERKIITKMIAEKNLLYLKFMYLVNGMIIHKKKQVNTKKHMMKENQI